MNLHPFILLTYFIRSKLELNRYKNKAYYWKEKEIYYRNVLNRKFCRTIWSLRKRSW